MDTGGKKLIRLLREGLAFWEDFNIFYLAGFLFLLIYQKKKRGGSINLITSIN